MAVAVTATVVIVADGCAAFGSTATGARRARMERSPQYGDGTFVNPQPMWNDVVGSMGSFLGAPEALAPAPGEVAVDFSDGRHLLTPPSSGLRVTWLGHSTLHLEIDGVELLTDPIFGGRASPWTWVGPKRWYPPPVPLGHYAAHVPDAVVISHDHHDHLQHETLAQIADWDTTFIVPLGVGAHLEGWGVPAGRIVELDWWESTTVKGRRGGEVVVHCTPARHASGRHVFDQNHTLWASYAVVGNTHRAYFSGDTGLFPALSEIGERFGPFDVTLIETGAYNPAWPDWHIGPEQAVRAHQMLRGRVMLPIHWGLWTLAPHGWTEPAERVVVEAERRQVTLAVPRPGQAVEPATPPPVVRWWPDRPWRTGQQVPVASTLVPPETAPPSSTPSLRP